MIRSDHIKNKNKNWSLLTFLLDQKQKMIKKNVLMIKDLIKNIKN